MSRLQLLKILFFTILVTYLFFGAIHSISNAAVEGTLKWTYTTGEAASAPAIGHDGTIYFGSESDKVYAIHTDGTLKWALPLVLDETSYLAVADNSTLYVVSRNYLHAIGPSGNLKWSYSIRKEDGQHSIPEADWEYMNYGPPAIAKNGTIYVFSELDLYAVNPDGTEKWVFPYEPWAVNDEYRILDGPPPHYVSPLAIGLDGTVYASSTEISHLIALHPDGTVKGIIHDQCTCRNLAIGKDGAIYVVTPNELDVMNPDGTIKWSHYWGWDASAGSISVGPDGSAYYSASSEGWTWFQKKATQDGSGWQFHGADYDPFYHPAAIGNDGTVYATTGGCLYAIRQDGNEKWSFDIGRPTSPAIGKDGTLYVGAGDGLYAINTGSTGPATAGWPMDGHDAQRTGQGAGTPLYGLPIADFDWTVDGFVYQDDTFYHTNQPDYADGNHEPHGGYDGSGGLHVVLGNVDGKDILNGMSGGWQGSFSVPYAMDASIELRYRLKMNRYDADECVKVLVSVDDGPAEELEELCGRAIPDTGWKKTTVSRHLSAGDHTITIGGYNNKKTYYLEFADIYFDDLYLIEEATSGPETNCSNGIDDDSDGMTDCEDLDCDGVSNCEYAFEQTCNDEFDNDADDLIDCEDPDCESSPHCAPDVLLSANFDSGVDGFLYRDDAFYHTSRPFYARGAHTPTGGFDGSGGLNVVVGNVDGRDILNGMSGGWQSDFSAPYAKNIEIELRYRLKMNRYDADECAQVLISVDNGDVDILEELCGRTVSDTGWKQKTITRSVTAGDHTITIGGYNNKKTYFAEFADIYIDDVTIE